VGVVLALCCVGKFLFSQNLAIFLNYCTRLPESKGEYGWNDFILASLITIANLIIIKPVWEEYKQTRLYKWWRNRNTLTNPDPIDAIDQRNLSGGNGASAYYPPPAPIVQPSLFVNPE